MERQISRRPKVPPEQFSKPQNPNGDGDEKIHNRCAFGRGFRLRASLWARSPNNNFFMTRKTILFGCVGFVLLIFYSPDKLVPTRGFLKQTKVVTPNYGIRREPIVIHAVGDKVMSDAGYVARPRVMGYYFRGVETSKFIGAEQLDPNLQRRLSHNIVKLSKKAVKAQEDLKNSDDYYHGRMDPFEEGDCVAQYGWQKSSNPTCNMLHEYSLTNLQAENENHVPVRFLSHGYWRDVWLVRDFRQREMIIKTLRYFHDFEERNYDRHRRDAVAMEHLSKSPYVIDIYGYCGNSVISEFAAGGDLNRRRRGVEKHNKTDLLLTAYQVASGLADIHNMDKEGRASIAHSDISTSQFVLVGNHYKLNDFNRCRFLRWDSKKNESCTFEVGNNPGTNRSPEEYRYEGQTEKIDIYSMGNVFYFITTGLWPFHDEKEKKAQKKIMNGERPAIPEKFLNSTEPEIKAMLQAMNMCWIHDPKKRATGREVQTYLRQELRNLRVHVEDF